MKKVFFAFIFVLSLFLLFSCNKGKIAEYENTLENLNSQKLLPQKYAYVGEKNGQLIFLDTINGKVIYINDKNQVTNYVDLDINAIEIDKIRNDNENNKTLHQAFDWGKQKIPNTKYSISLKARYYNDNLLYILEMEPYDAYLSRLANTIKIYFIDEDGFTLETIKTSSWSATTHDDGTRTNLNTKGSLPITLDNLLEIDRWYPVWEN